LENCNFETLKKDCSASEEIIMEPIDTDELNHLAKELLE